MFPIYVRGESSGHWSGHERDWAVKMFHYMCPLREHFLKGLFLIKGTNEKLGRSAFLHLTTSIENVKVRVCINNKSMIICEGKWIKLISLYFMIYVLICYIILIKLHLQNRIAGRSISFSSVLWLHVRGVIVTSNFAIQTTKLCSVVICISRMKIILAILLLTPSLSTPISNWPSAYWDIPGSYCQSYFPRLQCCRGRQDRCSVPILGTLYYWDSFCNRWD